MNYPFSTATPYIQAAMSQAVQAIMSGAPLPPNCLVMAVPYQPVHAMRPQVRMPPAIAGNDQMAPAQKSPYYGPSPYRNPPAATRGPMPPPPQNYNYALVPFVNTTKPKGKHRQQIHPALYNSSSFDSYMRNLSWSRLFDRRPSQKNGKRPSGEESATYSDKKTSAASKKPPSKSSLTASSSSSSSSSTTSDETIRRVTVSSRPPSNLNTKQQTKGKQHVKPNDVFIIKKP